MREQGSGHIVNVSSIGVQTNPPRFSAYVASKAALDAFTRVVSSETIGDGVTFTTIHMPLVRTPMIAPTKIYDSFPTITPDEAADFVCEAIRSQAEDDQHAARDVRRGRLRARAQGGRPDPPPGLQGLPRLLGGEGRVGRGQGVRRGDRAGLPDAGRALVVATHVMSSGELEATFSPANGMVCSALRHRGEELLGERRGLDVYVEAGKTMGIPLLHPWANRLGGFAYTAAGVEVELDRDSPEVRLEEHGLPIHGVVSAVHEWEVVEAGDAALVAGRDVTGLAEFPFDHRVEVAAELSGARLTLTTTVTPLGDRAVPIAFGHHPYFVLPGVPRAEWQVALPVREHLLLDENQIPTGEREPAGDLDGPLGERTFDDGYTVDPAGVTFVLAGGGRRIEVAFEAGYPFAQVYAPAVEDLICFEPMTAPADALRHDPRVVAPGESFSARFSVAVADV